MSDTPSVLRRALGDLQFPLAYETTLDGRMGLEYTLVEGERVEAAIDAGPATLGPDGHVAGGVMAALAESAASFGSVVDALAAGRGASGLSNATTVLGATPPGRLSIVGRLRGRAGDERVWDVEISTADDAVCAVSVVVVALR